MLEALTLKGGEKVLEIGAGSGYAAAVLSEIAAEAFTVERLGQLANKASATLADLGYNKIRAVAPFDTAEVKGLPDTYPFGVRPDRLVKFNG